MDGSSIKLSRREVLKLGVGVGAGLALGRIPAFAQTSSAPALIQRVIPSSGEMIPIVGIGTARRYNVGPSAAERAPLKEVLRRFPELGGKLVDTAPSYGTAETVVGDLVHELGNRDKLFLATKVRKPNAQTGIQEMEASFKLLRTDKIDMIEVHNMVGIDALLPVLREWKAAGRIRYLGASTSSEQQHDAFARMMEKEKLDFIQVNYALDDRPSAERILPLAKDLGMAVLINLPFGRGSLFQRVGDRPLPDWAAEFDVETWAQFFLKYLLSHPAVTCVIPGTAKVEYLVDNLGAGRGRMPDEATRRRIESFYDALPS